MRLLSLFVTLLFTLALPAKAFSFLCNGILADGTVHGDGCGVCDEPSAARWSNPNVPVIVDYKVLPKNLTESQWRSVVKSSFDAWNQVSGTNFRFVGIDAPSRREFGQNEAFHEIFWITDVEEWRRLVGTGEFGTLGATTPRYSCGNSVVRNRVIADSDLVLNGLDHNQWKIDCDNEDCMSPQTTLVHELGHFLGLDHPCIKCNNSIMSARAGYDLKYPMMDDMAGLRALYPHDTHEGFGFPCEKNEDCSEGNSCIEDKNIRYCTKSCLTDDACDLGATCRHKGAQSYCMFSAGMSKGIGENCARVPCSEPLICAGLSVENSFCFSSCGRGVSCNEGQQCVKLKNDTVSICVTIKQRGEICRDSELCDEHLYCVFEDNKDWGSCREPCGTVNADTTGCRKEERCEIIDLKELCVPYSDELSLADTSDGFSGYKKAESLRKPRSSFGCSTGSSNDMLAFLLILFLLRILSRAKLRMRPPFSLPTMLL